MTITHVTPREMELQAEVTRMEAELVAAKADIERYVRIASEQGAKLAALEAQEPEAWMRQWSFNGEETSFELYGVYGDCQKDAVYHGGICIPLYLAAGAKEKP